MSLRCISTVAKHFTCCDPLEDRYALRTIASKQMIRKDFKAFESTRLLYMVLFIYFNKCYAAIRSSTLDTLVLSENVFAEFRLDVRLTTSKLPNITSKHIL